MELLRVTPAVANLIRSGRTEQLYSLMETGSVMGMWTLEQHLARLASTGKVTVETARQAARTGRFSTSGSRAAPPPVGRGPDMAIRPRELVDAAVACGLVGPEVRDTLPPGAVRSLEEAADVLSIRGRVPSEALYRAVAHARGLPFADVNRAPPDLDLTRRLPRALLKRAGILPVNGDGDGTILATADPDDRQSISAVQRVLNRPLSVALAEPSVLHAVLDRVLAELDPAATAAPGTAAVDPVALLDRIFKEAYLRRASDVHLEPSRRGMRVRLRVDGTLKEVLGGLTPEQGAAPHLAGESALRAGHRRAAGSSGRGLQLRKRPSRRARPWISAWAHPCPPSGASGPP